jgi:hypothetical protein
LSGAAAMGENERGVVVISHSLGGLLLDQMRVSAKISGRHHWVNSLRATIRFGVPTLGAEVSKLANWLPSKKGFGAVHIAFFSFA